MSLVIRPTSPLDIPACSSILYNAFRDLAEKHGFPPDIPSYGLAIGAMTMVVASSNFHGVVAEWNGKVAGSVFVFEETSVAGIGPLTVAPDMQDRGIGRALMEHALEYIKANEFTGARMVQASYNPVSLALFTSQGFDIQETLLVLTGQPPRISFPGYEVRSASRKDVDDCNRLCRKVHGHDRAHEMETGIRQSSATVVEREGHITGYSTMMGFFGHAVTETNEDLIALIAASKPFIGPGIMVPARNSEVLRWCLENGLRVVQQMNLMTTGFYQPPRGAFLCSNFG